MFKYRNIPEKVWAFDVEWTPDPKAGRILYLLEGEHDDRKVLERMWREGGSTEENPRPFLKPILCRIVSLSAFMRTVKEDGTVKYQLSTLPKTIQSDLSIAEEEIIGRFLTKTGEHKPLLVGYNSHAADLKILIQRAVVKGISVPDFCYRPPKPWEGYDYFVSENSNHIDLFTILGRNDRYGPSLHEAATLSGIPGKIDMHGDDVHESVLQGDILKVIQYNEYDAITTFLLYLRMMYVAGCIDSNAYMQEQGIVDAYLIEESEKDGGGYLKRYVEIWRGMRGWR